MADPHPTLDRPETHVSPIDEAALTAAREQAELQAIEKDALAEMEEALGKLSSNDNATLIAAKNALKAILGRLPQNSTLRTTVEQAISKASTAISDDAVEDKLAGTGKTGAFTYFNDTAFSKAMAKYFTDPRERDYFESIKADGDYHITAIDKDGNVIKGASYDITGVDLREDVARIKFHTLEKSEQEKVLAEENHAPGSKKEQLLELKKSLEHVEGHEATKIIDQAEEHCKGKSTQEQQALRDEAHHAIRGKHKHFDGAHKNVEAMIDKTDEIEKKSEQVKTLEALANMPAVPGMGGMPQKMAELALPEAKKTLDVSVKEMDGMESKLKETLQKDVIEKGMLGDKTDNQPAKRQEQNIQITGGIAVVEQSSPTLVAAAPVRRDQGMRV